VTLLTTRRHVGGILDTNKVCVKCRGFSQTVLFDQHTILHTSRHKFTTLHCSNWNTSNMASFIIVDSLTLLSSMYICAFLFYRYINANTLLRKLSAIGQPTSQLSLPSLRGRQMSSHPCNYMYYGMEKI